MKLIALALTAALLAGCSQPASDMEPVDAGTEDQQPIGSGELAAEEQMQPEPAEPLKPSKAKKPSKPQKSPVTAKCLETEQTVFSCTMKSGKQASICITGEGSGQFAQYRFGSADQPAELVWPASIGNGKLAFKSVPYSGGGEAQISFVNAGTRYVVFSRMVRTNFVEGEPNYPAIDDGIMVMRGDVTLGELLCEGRQADMPIQYGLAQEYSKAAPEMFYAAE